MLPHLPVIPVHVIYVESAAGRQQRLRSSSNRLAWPRPSCSGSCPQFGSAAPGRRRLKRRGSIRRALARTACGASALTPGLPTPPSSCVLEYAAERTELVVRPNARNSGQRSCRTICVRRRRRYRTRCVPAHRPAIRIGCAGPARAPAFARHQLAQTDVRIREIKHETRRIRVTTPRNSTSTSPKSACAFARMPYRIHERLITLRRGLTPEPRHRPGHRGQGDPGAMLVLNRSRIVGRGMPLLAPVSRGPPRATARSRAADTGRSPNHAAPHRRPGR